MHRLLRRPRLVDEAWFALGGALAGAGAGLVVAALRVPPTPATPAAALPLAAWYVALARGFGIGWWFGLLWSALFAVSARRATPPASVRLLLPAACVAAALVVAGAAVARVATLPPTPWMAGGLAAGTLLARRRLARATRAADTP
jgi:hypothetical protein